MISLRPEEHKALSQYIYSLCAITLDESKAYLVENRLHTLVEETGCGSFGQLIGRAEIDATGSLKRRIVDAITTGETLFFRDTATFDLLRFKILPDLIDRGARASVKTPIRIWSAACSTGQELYSIAMVLKEVLGDPLRYGVRLLGTDISGQAVARASRGLYNQAEISRGLSDANRTRYFAPASGGWQIRDEIRAMASFKTLNLMQDFSALGKFDIVFCRNVAIYFTDADRVSLFARLGRALDPGGYLLVGSMESLGGICPQFETRRHLRAAFYQLKTGGAVP